MDRDSRYSAQNPYGRTGGDVPEAVASYVDVTALDPRARLRKYRPTRIKKTGAWAGVVLGVLMFLTVLNPVNGDVVADALLGLGFGTMMFVPGVYWLLCNRRDAKTLSEWVLTHREYQANWELLARDEQAVFAAPEELPVLPLRRWKTVVMVVIVGFFVAMAGSMLLPESTVA
ncbi:hypothetical protein [Corynebacterium kalidii]|uniref:Uncharacterized protein n=1 Tax=Corynebacterium kalidii TaxID=2931982 RepID=A0A9X1WL49_9CORY|nr:hypothetical protein [Corynebacterium kalidii]MCJ7858482.1 hypothetical protein [Corynebacterium kalidii]